MRRAPVPVRFLAVLLAASALTAAARAAAQEAAEARLDASRIGIEDELALTVSVPARRSGAPELPPLPDFELLGSQRVSRTSIVNGRMTRASEWVYRLRPLATGDFVIPAIPVPGYAPTKPLEVRVESGSLRPAPRRRPRRSPFASPFDPFDLLDPMPPRDPAPEIRGEDLFIRAEVADAEVHVGEQALVLYRLWSRLPVEIAAPVELAQPEGFWSEEVTLPDVPWLERGLDREELRARRALPGPRRERREENGVAYDTYPLLLRAVFPTGAGERELPGPRFEIAVRGQRSSFFGPSRVVAVRQAPAVRIRAEALPEARRPPGFEGAVGEYSLSAAVLREGAPLGEDPAVAGEALVLRLELRGLGNLRAAGTPALPEDAALRRSFRLFDPDTSLETGLVGDGGAAAFGGRRIWEYPMVPESGGMRTVGAISLEVFNPRTDAYERIASDPLRVRVEGAVAAGPAAAGPAAVERLGEDIRYLKPVGPGAAPAPGPFRPGALFLLSLALPALWNLGVFAALRRRAFRAEHAAVFRRKGAARAALRRLARVPGTGPEAEAAVGRILARYAADRFGGSSRGLTPEAAMARFVAAGADPATARRFRELLSRAEGARFSAGGAGGDGSAGRAEAEELVRALEIESGGRQ